MSRHPTRQELDDVVTEAHCIWWAARHLATDAAIRYLRELIANPHATHDEITAAAGLSWDAAAMTRIALEEVRIVPTTERVYLTHRRAPPPAA